jgi:hypothetical protein
MINHADADGPSSGGLIKSKNRTGLEPEISFKELVPKFIHADVQDARMRKLSTASGHQFGAMRLIYAEAQ